MNSPSTVALVESSTTAGWTSAGRPNLRALVRCHLRVARWATARPGCEDAYRFLGEHFIEQTNRAELANDDQHLVDASVNYAVNGLTFSVFGRNLTGEDGWAHGLNVSGLWAYASARAPRTWGAEVAYQFGAN